MELAEVLVIGGVIVMVLAATKLRDYDLREGCGENARRRERRAAGRALR